MIYKQGDIVLIPIPFTDLSSSKKRPVLIISSNYYNGLANDLVVAAITSNVDEKPYTVTITNSDLEDGVLMYTSCIKADKLYTLAKSIVIRKLGKIKDELVSDVIKQVYGVVARPVESKRKEIHRMLIDSLNTHSCENIDKIFHDGYIVHEGYNNADGTERTYPVSLDMMKQSIITPIKGMPDKYLTIKLQIAEADMIFTYCTATATHTGDWIGYPATNKELVYENVFISRFQGEKIIEHWVILDAFGMLRQIGIV